MGYFRTRYRITVEDGDTLRSIADQLGVSENRLYDQNLDVFGPDKNLPLQSEQELKHLPSSSRGVEFWI